LFSSWEFSLKHIRIKKKRVQNQRELNYIFTEDGLTFGDQMIVLKSYYIIHNTIQEVGIGLFLCHIFIEAFLKTFTILKV